VVSLPAHPPGPVRLRVRVCGTVQGVGFRPFVYRLAHEHGLGGWVLNDELGVLLEVEGGEAALDRFLHGLQAQPPVLAVIEEVVRDPVSPRGEDGFRILDSARRDASSAPPIASDCAPCPDCLDELRDPEDRRYRYPFINCTNCGPRFTIVTGVPYDRPLTTMAAFAMCTDCMREYGDPLDRRFHAQPNACPVCGPRLRVTDPDGRPITDLDGARDEVEFVACRLGDGAIVAVKSVGGFHLVCDGGDERAVAALRARKHREDKPFALLAGSLAAARALVVLTPEDEALLAGVARPIVLAPRQAGRDRVRVASAVAPGLPELGVMLPSAPLHELLIGDVTRLGADPIRPLVMTSGNVSDDPIAFTDEDALARLGAIADLFLLHDRGIETRTDDSVLRTVTLRGRRRAAMLRRSRGYVPAALALPIPASRPVLACGAEQKSTFCLAGGERAWVGHHIGDLEHYATLCAFRDGIRHFERLFALSPERIAHDLHPGYLSTQYALERDAAEHVAIQHHHAHLAACLAEHGVCEPAVGAIYDGTGLGTDGTVWGGELLLGGLRNFDRAGHLWTVRLPGGAAAIRQPWRMAAAWLDEAFGEERPLPRRLRGAVSERRWAAMRAVAADGTLSPLSSSVGRLLDAVGALCGLGAEVSYEGQTAIALEAAAWEAGDAAGYELELDERDGTLVLDPRALIRALSLDLERGADVPALAAGVHVALSRATAQALERIARATGVGTAVLSGGVFQNRWLLQSIAERLDRAGVRVLVPERLPPNDGGISFGQVAIAAARTGDRVSDRVNPGGAWDAVEQVAEVVSVAGQHDVVIVSEQCDRGVGDLAGTRPRQQ
jgi:hydrogenase maturation protein HypF